MLVSAIAAVAENGVIGRGNEIPWHLPADLKHFKQLTSWHHIVLGRKSYESIGRPLPRRVHCIVSRNTAYPLAESCLLFGSVEGALHYAHQRGETEAFIIGGGEIYRQSQLFWDRLYLTRVHAEVEGDVFFPKLDWSAWRLTFAERHRADERNEFDYTFERYERL